MSFVGSRALLEGLVRRAKISGEFLNLCPTGLIDAVPQTVTYPYAVIATPFEMPDRTFGQGGHDCLVTVDIYTRDGSTTRSGTGRDGFQLALDIAEQLLAALTDIDDPIDVDGHDVTDVDLVTMTADRSSDGVRHVQLQLEALLEDSLDAT